ncbi:efflux RND transporter periplasmic adaptor subunit [Piscinibacter sp. XHJ-5]|uniref:efflux RND transporter periplasmic adaptor subunit n=1 Tax=Piscinibacter sp. XHJ-5 TaxID=3037797 RepID=UPI002452CE6D|nr:efflux RND transporter periplasmic adaptor subunit [Piscinibacter sp. XHJ-5]
MNKLHTVVAVAGIAVAGGIAYWIQNKSPAYATTEGQAARAPAAAAPGATPAGVVAVEVARAESRSLLDDATAVGSLRSRQGIMLRPEVAGRIVKLGFVDGQPVRRGQLLVQLDDQLQAAELRQAEAQVGIAQANYQRNKDLVAQNFVSQRVLDESSAGLEVAQAQAALARTRVSRMKITAPFDGIVGIRNVSLGDYVKDGADLVGLEDISSVFVDFRMPERFLTRVRPQQRADVTLDALPGKSMQATIEAVDPQLDANGRSLLVRARLDNQAGLLRPGMFARVRVVFARRDNAIVVPEEALVPQGNKQFVVKVLPSPKGPVSQRIEVAAGARQEGKVEVQGTGIAAGDTVVTAGQAQLMRGDQQPLRLIELGKPGGTRGPAGAPSAPAPA